MSLLLAGSAGLVLVAASCESARTTSGAPPRYDRLSHGEAIRNVVPCRARPLPLDDVRLTGGPLKRAQELDAAYLLQLEPDRMLYYLRQTSGLEPKA
ncbi:MAG TPA: hypothetical protein VFV81_09510, partial [Verrucomicrobiae bacterium]|nr:hypothetical protein [Verrucomicrobiae bacterium]